MLLFKLFNFFLLVNKDSSKFHCINAKLQSIHNFTIRVLGCTPNILNDIQGGPKNLAQFFVYALTLPNINRFSKLFHCRNQENICNNTITKDPITPQVCRYTTL